MSTPFIKQLKLRNFLSYGDDPVAVELHPLNVLIGPNASGKSNLIEALSLLKHAPGDLAAPIRAGGGISEWLWKGVQASPTAEIEALIDYPDGLMPLRYRLCFTEAGQKLEITDEVVENESPTDPQETQPFFFYRFQQGEPVLSVREETTERAGSAKGRGPRKLRREEITPNQSVLSQRKDPDQYPEVTYLGKQFSQISIYRDWQFGRATPARRPQQADLPEDFLAEDAGNLGLVINDLQHHPAVWKEILSRLVQFYETAEQITTRVHAGTVQIYVHETGLSHAVPASRLSDGTLRYLSLLAVLCHPSPPPLLMIEEPELGLHPDILPIVAELLVEASQRTQLIVTTHSDILVSALSEAPESVVVCENTGQGTAVRRLDTSSLKEWLEDRPLGELWREGALGGNRW